MCADAPQSETSDMVSPAASGFPMTLAAPVMAAQGRGQDALRRTVRGAEPHRVPHRPPCCRLGRGPRSLSRAHCPPARRRLNPAPARALTRLPAPASPSAWLVSGDSGLKPRLRARPKRGSRSSPPSGRRLCNVCGRGFSPPPISPSPPKVADSELARWIAELRVERERYSSVRYAAAFSVPF